MKVTRRIVIPALALLLALACTAPVLAAGVVNFAAKATVGSGPVTLADLVRPGSNLEPGVQKSLDKVVVGAAPALGKRKSLSGSRLRALVRQAKLPTDHSVLIPAGLTITRASQKVTSADLERAYLSALRSRLKATRAEADVHSLRTGGDLMVPSGKLRLRVHFLGSRLRGMVPGRVEVLVDGSLAARRRISAQVDLYSEVVVAATSLPAKQMLTRDDLSMARVRLNDLGGAVVSDPEQLVGMRTRTPVAAGQPMDLGRVERTPLIRRGEVVRMICSAGGMKITAKGRAEQTGYKGSNIKLTNLASKREVYGKVLDAGSVLVKF